MAKKHIKTNAMRILETAGLEFEVMLYECDEFTDGVTVAGKLGLDPDMVYKTLVTENKAHENFVFVVPVAKELDLKKCAAAAGQKSLEMIHVKDITRVTGYIRGGCSPIGMKKQFPTVIDKSAEPLDQIYFSGGKRGVQIKMNPIDLKDLTGAKFDDITRN